MSNAIHDLIKIKYIREGYLPNVPYHLISDSEMLKAFINGLNDTLLPYGYEEWNKETVVNYATSVYNTLSGYFIDNYPLPSTDNIDLKYDYFILLESIIENIKYVYNGFADVNGDGFVSLVDLEIIEAIIAGSIEPSEELEKRADLNNDGHINTKDVVIFKEYYFKEEYKSYTLGDLIVEDWVYSYMLGIPVSNQSDIQDKHNFLVLLGMDNMYDVFDAATSLKCNEVSKRYFREHNIVDRSPTVFGEPHVIKALRLNEFKM